MKITIENETPSLNGTLKTERVISVQIPYDSDAFEYIDTILRAGVQLGYSWKSLHGALGGLYEEYNESNQQTNELINETTEQ